MPIACIVSPFFAVEIEMLHFRMELNLEESLQKRVDAPESRHQSKLKPRTAEGLPHVLQVHDVHVKRASFHAYILEGIQQLLQT
jgi:hypothetical protein